MSLLVEFIYEVLVGNNAIAKTISRVSVSHAGRCTVSLQCEKIVV